MRAGVELQVAKPRAVRDSLGRKTRQYGAVPGVYDVDSTVMAYGVAPASEATGHEPHHERIDWDFEVFVPAGSGIDVFDRVRVFGQWCEVHQMVDQWSQPPVGFSTKGEVIHLKKVTG